MSQPKHSIVGAVLTKSFTSRDKSVGRTSDYLELEVLEQHGGTVVLRCWGGTANRLNEFLLIHNIYRFDMDELDRIRGARRIPT